MFQLFLAQIALGKGQGVRSPHHTLQYACLGASPLRDASSPFAVCISFFFFFFETLCIPPSGVCIPVPQRGTGYVTNVTSFLFDRTVDLRSPGFLATKHNPEGVVYACPEGACITLRLMRAHTRVHVHVCAHEGALILAKINAK